MVSNKPLSILDSIWPSRYTCRGMPWDFERTNCNHKNKKNPKSCYIMKLATFKTKRRVFSSFWRLVTAKQNLHHTTPNGTKCWWELAKPPKVTWRGSHWQVRVTAWYLWGLLHYWRKPWRSPLFVGVLVFVFVFVGILAKTKKKSTEKRATEQKYFAWVYLGVCKHLSSWERKK